MAQERKKRRIVLTSILKPVDDTRLFEKMGISLADAGYDVFIIGFPSSHKPVHDHIHCIPLPFFKRLSLSRVLAKWRVLSTVFRLRPSIVVVSTHELLLPAVILKALTSARVVYDVRENYYRNILHSKSFPALIRYPLASLVRLKETMTAPFIDHFLLAERGYDTEFNFHRPHWTAIENKAAYSRQANRTTDRATIRLLFSGTLAESTGVYRAISLCQELHRMDERIHLTVIGYAALPEDQKKIKETVATHPYIKLIGGDSLVPHETVMEYLQQADFGIIAYPPAHHTINSRPTKLYEYLSAGLPIILERHWPWVKEFESCRPFVFVDFESPDLPKLLKEIREGQFYSNQPTDVTWTSEASKLLAVMNGL